MEDNLEEVNNNVDPKELIAKLREVLQDANALDQTKRIVSIQLAHMGKKEANDVIAEYMSGLDDFYDEDMKIWAEIALDEGEFMTSEPLTEEEKERLFEEEVHQEYSEIVYNTEEELIFLEEEEIKLSYEHDIIKRLKKKAQTDKEKRRWESEEKTCLKTMERIKKDITELKEDLETAGAMEREIASELMESATK